MKNLIQELTCETLSFVAVKKTWEGKIAGLSPQVEMPDESMGSKRFRSLINNAADLKKLKKPETIMDEKRTADLEN